jgi:hypothetical protein
MMLGLILTYITVILILWRDERVVFPCSCTMSTSLFQGVSGKGILSGWVSNPCTLSTSLFQGGIRRKYLIWVSFQLFLMMLGLFLTYIKVVLILWRDERFALSHSCTLLTSLFQGDIRRKYLIWVSFQLFLIMLGLILTLNTVVLILWKDERFVLHRSCTLSTS